MDEIQGWTGECFSEKSVSEMNCGGTTQGDGEQRADRKKPKRRIVFYNYNSERDNATFATLQVIIAANNYAERYKCG
jgi:hypothetical protein